MASGSPPPAPCSVPCPARPGAGAPAGRSSELLEAARSLEREAEGLEARACAARGRAQSLAEQAATDDARRGRRPRAGGRREEQTAPRDDRCRSCRACASQAAAVVCCDCLALRAQEGAHTHGEGAAALDLLQSVSAGGRATCGCLLPTGADGEEEGGPA